MDKREIYMLTALHEPIKLETAEIDRETGQKIKKSLCIAEYNENMGGVD